MFSQSFYSKVVDVLGGSKYQLIFIFLAFLANVVLELLGLSLVAPYLSLLLNPTSELSGFVSGSVKYIFPDTPNYNARFNLSILLGSVYFIKILFSLSLLAIITFFLNKLTAKLSIELLVKLFTEPQLARADKNSAKDIQSLLVLSKNFPNQVVKPLLSLVSDILVITSILIFLIFAIGDKLYFAVLYFCITLALYFALFKNLQKKWGKAVNSAADSSVTTFSESNAGLKQIKVLGIESFFIHRMERATRLYVKNQFFSQIIVQAPKHIFELSAVLGMILFVLTNYSESSPNDLITSIGLIAVAMLRVLPSFASVSRSLVLISSQHDTVERLHSIIDVKKDNQIGSHSGSKKHSEPFQSLKISKLKFSYSENTKTLINGLTIDINKGEIIGITGSSGAGKSTFLDLIMGLIEPNSGDISFNGVSIKNCKENFYSKIMYIPQEPFIIDGSIQDNIAIGVNPSSVDVEMLNKAISISKLEPLVANHQNGVHFHVGENGKKLSGGQRQRLQIARAIYMKRDFLVFDEATSALDIKTENQILSELCALRGICTVLIVSHRSNLKKYCSKYFVLKKGELVHKTSVKGIGV